MTDMTVARTILEQLGNKRFVMMTGAKLFVGTADSLCFRLPNRFAKNGINIVRIVLTPADVYEVTFGRSYNGKWTTKAIRSEVYAEDLREVFYEETGLLTSL